MEANTQVNVSYASTICLPPAGTESEAVRLADELRQEPTNKEKRERLLEIMEV